MTFIWRPAFRTRLGVRCRLALGVWRLAVEGETMATPLIFTHAYKGPTNFSNRHFQRQTFLSATTAAAPVGAGVSATAVARARAVAADRSSP